MQLTALDLTDFRSYPRLSLSFQPGITVLVGQNGQGKTNIVEALWYLATLSSHRVPHDAALVHRGESTAIIRAGFVRAGRPLQVDLEITPGKANRARLQGQNVSRLRDLLGEVRAVLFAPEDLGLVKADPEGRRRFLDELLFEIAPRFASVKADYDRVLKQRGNLLKQMRSMRRGGSGRSVAGLDPADSAASTLEVWDQQLARFGAELLRARLHLVNRLTPHLGYSYLRVSTDEGADPGLDLPPDQRGEVNSPASIRYRSSVLDELEAPAGSLPGTREIQDAMLEMLAAGHDDEIDRGATLTGPHRDDMEIRLHDFPAKGYASHGESWSLALALRLASYDLLRLEEGDLGDGEPILILDDVFSELDTRRRERLGRIVTDASQVLITTANDTDIPDSLDGEIHVIEVSLGDAVPRGSGSRS
ncbi:MAG: DNA replication/repair protein RecF [Brachybacterium sp.]|uniref:DNA replication/repair protein RecF n=1 Tax=Brachybacterium sp. TaxID=1891286 RepID=UPI00264EBC4E|nr:DNA replication/repair protein RecF [Brachybacterium sp.]MDN6301502.1 DNA replication/repair protein RecF [Brachybacterium sp.]MDN6329523.1 DNA replication/repair protein RecF [Brachybacterium sp.]MDN6399071.1 DNA replication/repair protein RecF [Brachybacterium sp.]